MAARERVIRKVRLLLAAQVASQVGDAAFAVLLLWTALRLTSSPLVLGAVATLNYLPILLFGLVGGWAADRVPRRGLMIASDAVRGVVALSIPAVAAAGWLSPWVLAGAGFLLFTASAFFNPARDAYIPSLVEADELIAANSMVQISVPLGWLLGPAACAALLAVTDAVTLFAGVGVLFLVSVAFLLRLRPQAASAGPAAGALDELLAGLVLAWRDARLRWLLVITAVDNLLIMGPAVVGTPLLVTQVLGGGGREYALLEVALAGGVFLGLPLAAWGNRNFGQGRVLIAGILLDGLTYLPLAWVTGLPAAAGVILLHGVSIPLITVTRSSLVQRITPPAQLGRVFALISITVLGLTALSSALTGVIASVVPINVVFGVIAVLAAACAPAAWASREFREA